MKEVYVVDAKRTAVGSFLGSLSGLKGHELGSIIINNLMASNKIHSEDLDEVIIGQVLTAGQGQNPARQAAVNAGIDFAVPAYNINKVCGSGLKAIALAFDSIALGRADLIIAGGQESMSNSLHGSLIRKGNKMGDMNINDLMLSDGLIDAFNKYHMGITAENVARKYNISRNSQDEFAYNSQVKASRASKAGYFKAEIVPVPIKVKKETASFHEDEFIRHDSDIAALTKLKPAFDASGTVTAANSSGINDGSAMFLLASEEAVKKYHLTPVAKILNHASAGVDPSIMGIGPATAVNKLLSKTYFNKNQIEIFELNEAFAAQAIAVNTLLEIDPARVNISGGAIAIGHPIGASGARIAVTLVHNMIRARAKHGVAGLCIGGGMGIAMSFERL